MNDIGAAIRKNRKAAGLTQEQLSEKCGITRSHISEIEAGKYNPTTRTLCKIAKACNKKLKDFL